MEIRCSRNSSEPSLTRGRGSRGSGPFTTVDPRSRPWAGATVVRESASGRFQKRPQAGERSWTYPTDACVPEQHVFFNECRFVAKDCKQVHTVATVAHPRSQGHAYALGFFSTINRRWQPTYCSTRRGTTFATITPGTLSLPLMTSESVVMCRVRNEPLRSSKRGSVAVSNRQSPSVD